MLILPLDAWFVIFRYWSLILAWVSRCVYAHLLFKYRQHWLVQFQQVIDLVPIEQGCAAFHRGSGRGSAVNHAVPRLVRALLVRYLFALSYRQTEEWIECHLLAKWFVGYGLFESPPDHTTLQRFELWVLEHQPYLFFDEILHQIDMLCPEDRRRTQLVDTYAMLARGARTTLIELIRDACRKLLGGLEGVDPERLAALLEGIDVAALFGAPGDKPSKALKPAERAARLQQVVREALRLERLMHSMLDSPPFVHPDAAAPLRLWLKHLDKIIADETRVACGASGDPDEVSVRERPNGQKGAYRIGCVNEPAASYRHHGADQPAHLGFNASLLATRTFVRGTLVATGAQPDPLALPELLTTQRQHHGFFPAKLAGDQAYGSGKVRAQVELLTQAATQLIALLPDLEKRSDRFPPSAFRLSPDGATLTCPNGVTSPKRFLSENREGCDFRFTARMCHGCPVWDQCRDLQANPQERRTVFISHYRPHIEAALAYNRSDEFKQEIKERSQVERIIYNLTHIHGARQARSTGLPKVNFQARMAATAFNIRQLLRLMSRRPQAQAV
jgi:transposase